MVIIIDNNQTTSMSSINNDNNNNNNNNNKWTISTYFQRLKCPFRFIIALMGILASILLCSTRYNVSIAIVSMVKDFASTTPSNSYCHRIDPDYPNRLESLFRSSSSLSASLIKSLNETAISQEVTWTDLEQGIVLGAYYYGYAATHIFGGRWSERYGPKWVTVIGLIGAAILNAILPFGSNFFVFALLRVLIGCFHGVVEPALFFMFKKWFPPNEQTLALSVLLIGNALGLILNVPISAAITHIILPADIPDWSLLFFGGSALHLIWLVLWIFLVTDIPENHRLITDNEISYIRQNSHNVLETNLRTVPWQQILKTKALYASIMAKLCWSFNHAIIIDNGPSFLNKIFNFNMLKASEHIALIYTVTVIVFIFSAFLFARLDNWTKLSHTRLRKLFQAIVFIGSSVTMFAIANNECNLYLLEIFIIINMITQGFTSVGEYPMINEFAGYYSGTVYGITITFDSLARALAPLIRCELVNQSDLKANWVIVFYITAILNLIGLIIFELLASTTPKQWALKRDLVRTISPTNDGHIERPVKKELKLELQNPNYRQDIDTETDDWRQFKTSTLVQ
uniref:Sialin-like n=1 Tax=Dermatophagoides pteronyssinus TaxID=6956 RepID=A0A6P6XT97_DERPT|nr:sialin-like [Dermatophagoides pteronyssinus]